jgi:hypothetical protein
MLLYIYIYLKKYQKEQQIYLKFFVVKQSFFATFVDITVSLSLLCNQYPYFNNLFLLW